MKHLVNANWTMEAMARHQVMPLAFSTITTEKYFEDVMVANALEAQNEHANVEMLELGAQGSVSAAATCYLLRLQRHSTG